MPVRNLLISSEINKVEGDFGIEIEAEFKPGVEFVPELDRNALHYWQVKRDDSLRGVAAEFVTRGAVYKKDLEEVLHGLERQIGPDINHSFRAGTHVHVNMTDCRELVPLAFAFLFYHIEDWFVSMCGEWREGNLFCLRASDSFEIINNLFMCIRDDYRGDRFRYRWEIYRPDLFKYSALNLCPVSTLGTVEIRCFDTVNNFTEYLLPKISILKALKTVAKEKGKTSNNEFYNLLSLSLEEKIKLLRDLIPFKMTKEEEQNFKYCIRRAHIRMLPVVTFFFVRHEDKNVQEQRPDLHEILNMGLNREEPVNMHVFDRRVQEVNRNRHAVRYEFNVVERGHQGEDNGEF